MIPVQSYSELMSQYPRSHIATWLLTLKTACPMSHFHAEAENYTKMSLNLHDIHTFITSSNCPLKDMAQGY